MVISDKNGTPLEVKDLPEGELYMFDNESQALFVAGPNTVYKVGFNYYVKKSDAKNEA